VAHDAVVVLDIIWETQMLFHFHANEKCNPDTQFFEKGELSLSSLEKT
jgi:hypothetical protein